MTLRPRPPPAKPRGAGSARAIARLRAICLALPDAVEKRSHGEPTWFAGKGKVFAMLDDHHHGAPHLAVWLPQPLGAQEALVAADPVRFFRPPYVGPSGWVGVVLDGEPDWAMVERLVRDAYRLVATKTLRARLEAPVTPAAGRAARPAPSRRPRPAAPRRARAAPRSRA